MAIMIPDKPRMFDPKSREGEMFEALEKGLPDTYYVIHSFKHVYVDKEDKIFNRETLVERETDFLIINPACGIICLEAKAGKVRYEDGKWLYSNGDEMKHNGPYNQADINKWDLFRLIKKSTLKIFINNSNFLLYHGVWFPSLTRKQLLEVNLPPEAHPDITLTEESLDDPEPMVKKIYSLKLSCINDKNMKNKTIGKEDIRQLFDQILCPKFHLAPLKKLELDMKKNKFRTLLEEQYVLLNYLVYQRTAVINGAAGTGKTLIAVEKAKRHASNGEKVLFLCYNAFLRDDLKKNNDYDNIEYTTIAALACKLCNTKEPDYERADKVILELGLDGKFPYQHIIVDEGQDFGNEKIEENNILQTLHDIIVDYSDKKGTFYVFYDALQLIQAKNIPQFIVNADCKLTLYKNCRNTISIAKTSLKPISERDHELFDGALPGTPAKLHYVLNRSDETLKIVEIINELNEEGLKDITILTCETEARSVLADQINSKFFKKIKFTTCRKFKGLEADAVILVDVSDKTFLDDKMMFYVGASRARLRLDIVTSMNDEQCKKVLNELPDFKKKIKNAKRDLAFALNAKPDINLDLV